MAWCSNFIMNAGKHVPTDTCTYKATLSEPHEHTHAHGTDSPEAACLEVWFMVLKGLNKKHCRAKVIHITSVFVHLRLCWRSMQSLKRMFVTALWHVLAVVCSYNTFIKNSWDNIWYLVFDGQRETVFYIGLFWGICTCKISSLYCFCFAMNHW